MTYPKIYSLSTAGIIKHYNHDYLFHHKRTDFIGPNGVGKSILADLLQLMFIYDRELVRFGTEDVKQTRYIHTLPHLTGCAYCFLNIIIQKDKFITIGIQIQNQERRRIIPFVIAKSADLSIDVAQLALDKSELLFSKDLIANGAIPDLQELAEVLINERKLKLSFFKSREAVNDYYNFLSNKEILPINLSKENNLKAFAKVIQSFSKAKTLKLSGKEASKNLKEFLFEDTDEDIASDFDKEKNALEKVLREYKRLNDDIQILRNKQKWLDDLRHQDDTAQALFKEFKIGEASNCYLNHITQQRLEAEGKEHLLHQDDALRKLKELIAKIPAIEKIIKKQTEAAEENYNQIYRYKQLTEHFDKLKAELIELKMIMLPKIDKSWIDHVPKVDIAIRTVKDIKNDIKFVAPYLERYNTLVNIETARGNQLDELSKLTGQINAEKEKKKRLLDLLSNNNEDSLLSWYVTNIPVLSEEQIQAVLYFATLPTSETQFPQNGTRVISPEELRDFKVSKSETGIWLKSGALSEFVTHNPDAYLLTSHSELNQRVQQLVGKANAELAQTQGKLQALNDIRDGLAYDKSMFEYEFDTSISEASKIEQLKVAIACLMQINEMKAKYEKEKAWHKDELGKLQRQFNLRYSEPEVVARDLKIIKDRWVKRANKLSRYSGEKEGELKSLEKDIANTRDDLDKVVRNLIELQKEFNQLRTDYYRHFQENITQFNSEIKDLSALEQKYNDAYEAYKTTYIQTTSYFEETKSGSNVAVNYEIQKHSYSFSELERALLGSRIKTTDDITAALQEANNNRTQIADNIRDSMIKIFTRTSDSYAGYKTQVQTINAFFVNRKISGKYNFNVEFEPNPNIKIEDIQKMGYDVRLAATRGELQFDQSITDFLEEFFKKMTRLKDKVPIAQLLDPKTYFHLSTKLEDEFGEDISGSTGESYSAIALLGVARLSTQKTKLKGLRFIILEELGSMDNTNFNIFPSIAEEFQYQIITMAPHTFNIGLSDEWYAHHLIKGKITDKINYCPSSSYFKTKDLSENLSTYLNRMVK